MHIHHRYVYACFIFFNLCKTMRIISAFSCHHFNVKVVICLCVKEVQNRNKCNLNITEGAFNEILRTEDDTDIPMITLKLKRNSYLIPTRVQYIAESGCRRSMSRRKHMQYNLFNSNAD